MVVFMYSTVKFSYLITKHGPNISTYYREDDMSGVTLNLNDHKFRFAFTVEDYFSPIAQKNDPRYVKYLFRMYG